MAAITIRDLDDSVKERLRIQAAEHGHSMEAEARAILEAATAPRRRARNVAAALIELGERHGGVDLNLSSPAADHNRQRDPFE